jgi:hypothetical protein
MENIFQYRLLNNKHLFLANEFIIAFIDGFYEQMAIEIKENYTIDEIERGFNHLLFWSNESLESLAMRNGINRSDLLKEIPYIDPNEIWRLLSTVEILSINQTVSEKIKMGVILPQIVVGNEKLPFGLFQELFSYIKSKNYNTVSRTFKPLDYAKKTHYTCIPYDGYDESIFKSNLKTLFKNLPDIYLTLVNQNFPKIANKIKLFGGANKILVIFDFKEDYKSMESPWVYILYYFDSELNKIQTEFYEKSEFCKVTDYDLECLKTSITINGKNFKNVGVQYQEVGFILKNLPVMNYVYKEIEGNLNNYIQRISNK